MDENTKTLLHMMERLLIQFLELSQRISDDDLRELSAKLKQDEKRTKSIKDALDLGNLFLLAFFLREAVENLRSETADSQSRV
jgi:hypothetical protein